MIWSLDPSYTHNSTMKYHFTDQINRVKIKITCEDFDTPSYTYRIHNTGFARLCRDILFLWRISNNCKGQDSREVDVVQSSIKGKENCFHLDRNYSQQGWVVGEILLLHQATSYIERTPIEFAFSNYGKYTETYRLKTLPQIYGNVRIEARRKY